MNNDSPHGIAHRSPARRYGVAALATALAALLTAVLHPVVGAALFFVPSLAAVVIAAWLADLGPALCVVAAGVLLNAYLFANPAGSFLVTAPGDRLRLLVFAATGIVLALIIDSRNRVARAYREQREWWRVSLASVGDGVIVTDGAGRITFMNAVSETLTGWTAGEAMGRRLGEVFRILNEEARSLPDDPVDRVIRTGQTVGLANHTLLIRRDGTEIGIDDSAAPVRDEDGRLLGVILIYRDVTARRQADRSLHDQSERLRLQAELLDHAHDAVFVRGEDDRITYWNAACVELYGWTAQQAVGQNAHELLATLFPLPRDQFIEILRREHHWSGELVHTTRDGRSVTVDSRQVLVPGEEGGRTQILEINRDITGRKLARQREAMLLEASSLLSSSLDSERVLQRLARLVVPALADWCVIDLIESDGGVRRVAGSHGQASEQELIDRVVRMTPGEQTPGAETMRTGRPVMAPATGREIADRVARDDEHRDVIRQLKAESYMAVPLFARGRIVGAITFVYAESRRVYDNEALLLAESVARRAGLAIDNARLFQEAQEANRLKDEFLATLSHELRTPLNAIRGWTQMLLAGKVETEGIRRAYETIDRNAQAQTQLITDILDVSRIITGKLRLEVGVVDLVEIIETAVEGVRPAAEAKRLRLDASYDAKPARMVGDRNRLQQILWNLLSNAVKFTPAGGSIDVRLGRDNSRFQVQVIDTGVGIRRDFLPHMFERFTQSDASASRAYGGLGLGLAISRHLAELHGGTIVADSPGEGQGSTFTVTLPVRVTGPAIFMPAPADYGRRQSAQAATAALEGIRVLVVDDESDARELMTAVLRDEGAEVMAADSAADARVYLRDERPHVIVSDIGMPGEDGYAFIRSVRALTVEEGGETPAIAITAYAREEDRRRALAAGYQEHIAKPVIPADLVVVVGDLARRALRPVAE